MIYRHVIYVKDCSQVCRFPRGVLHIIFYTFPKDTFKMLVYITFKRFHKLEQHIIRIVYIIVMTYHLKWYLFFNHVLHLSKYFMLNISLYRTCPKIKLPCFCSHFVKYLPERSSFAVNLYWGYDFFYYYFTVINNHCHSGLLNFIGLYTFSSDTETSSFNNRLFCPPLG